MPPFRLEPPDPLRERHEYRMLTAKRCYSPGVKIVEWEKSRDSKPIDNDPFCQGKINHFLSHYNRLGMDTGNNFSTTTGDTLEQIYIKDKYSYKRDKKTLINFISYKDWLPCEEPNSICPPRCVDNYLTTMHYSYTPPYPYVMEGISCPMIPFLQNRKFKKEDPRLSEHKFYDEGFENISSRLGQIKSFRFKSYNPCTDKYSDGSEYPERKQGCYKLEYD